MKNLLLSAILGLAAVAATPALSQASAFGLFTGCGCGCCSKCTFCVRPYNAFTPVCCGNITCMGCMPFAGPGYGYPGYGAPSYPGFPTDDAGGTCCGSPETGGEVISESQNLPALPPKPKYAQPEPLPNPTQQPAATAPAQSMRQMNPYGTVQAGYRPAYVPTYNPYPYYNYYAPMGRTPYYWNAK